MPDLFEKNPVTKTMYDKISKKNKEELTEVMEKAKENGANGGTPVPGLDEMAGKLDTLTQQMEKYQKTLNGVQSMGDQMVSSVDSRILAAGDEDFLQLYEELLNVVPEEDLVQMKQKAHDLLVEKKFLELRFEENDTDSSKFADWYAASVENQYDEMLVRLLENQKRRETELDEQIQLKKSVLENQNAMFESTEKVSRSNDEEITEESKSLESTKNNLLLSKRNAEFDISEVQLTNQWTNFIYKFVLFFSFTLIVLWIISSVAKRKT